MSLFIKGPSVGTNGPSVRIFEAILRRVYIENVLHSHLLKVQW